MDEYIGVIRMFAGTFVPQNWMLCDGTILSIYANNALFNVIGNAYGGDGVKSFALPDLRSRIPVALADGSESLQYVVSQGQLGGEESHVLVMNELPLHTHTVEVSNVNASSQTPSGSTSALAGFGSLNGTIFTAGDAYNNGMLDTTLHNATISPTGASRGHENRQPFLALNYIICVQGINPPRD